MSAFPNVDVTIASLNLGAISAHGELINTSVLSPVASHGDVAREDNTLGLLLKEGVEVVNDEGVGVAGGV